ncbi:hypothetical protein EMIHUDRAFT_455689 [Emiliania huxleyi CCMP1516]|uniref:PIPK domain-containing protein n=2 Tax=Emiliania huxleyi TaxID=2903 RepID=A0A0D3KDN1_EMIH1|nr:hypothetical protein EMIHUDRAFT_455689 [Emiliania huxleyi CCMP1516]EOD33866.1 hypothetical protein EMIHUDRAFT_455689 [Emiliania huxleyi CCMP1516]|eukprot:XP_005786295.1 hypothetical protein EMIHUDRAFT_455689 [Emiliania huxleyi CCMP1516]
MPAPPPMDPGPSRAESSEAGLGESSKVATSKMITSDHDSFELIFMMLMGIRTAVGKFASKELPAEMGPAEFNQNWEGDFLASGTPETPAHSHSDYRFKEYSPLIFRQLRERFGISSQDYMLSLTSEYVLVEMFTNSKSGSFFFYSADYRFVLKTCTKREAAFLMSALPPYHQHLMSHRFTLLCRFFGLHRVQQRSGKVVYFVVMGNIFPIDKPAPPAQPALSPPPKGTATALTAVRGEDKKRRLLAQVKKDCELLERLEVIDYSILIGIHRAGADRTRRRVIARPACPRIPAPALGSRRNGEAAGAHEQLLREQAARRPASASEEGALTVDKEVYYVGVIDILCEYGFQKQLEHSYKAACHDL